MSRIIEVAIALLLVGIVALVMCGCNTAEKAIDSASQKSLVGSGFLAINKITVTDTATNSYTPQLFSLFVNGKYVSLLNKAKFLYYDKQSSASTFNSSAVTTEENLIIQVDSKESLADVIAKLKALQEESGNAVTADGTVKNEPVETKAVESTQQ